MMNKKNVKQKSLLERSPDLVPWEVLRKETHTEEELADLDLRVEKQIAKMELRELRRRKKEENYSN